VFVSTLNRRFRAMTLGKRGTAKRNKRNSDPDFQLRVLEVSALFWKASTLEITPVAYASLSRIIMLHVNVVFARSSCICLRYPHSYFVSNTTAHLVSASLPMSTRPLLARRTRTDFFFGRFLRFFFFLLLNRWLFLGPSALIAIV
jgi:hypothetical protein